jgi:hypothetical protein
MSLVASQLDKARERRALIGEVRIQLPRIDPRRVQHLHVGGFFQGHQLNQCLSELLLLGKIGKWRTHAGAHNYVSIIKTSFWSK